MSDGFQVGDLDAHIRFVDESVVAPMQLATDAGRPLDHGAYGIIGQAFAVVIRDAVAAGAASVRAHASTAGDFSAGLRATRDAYAATEDANSRLLGGAR